MGDEAFIDSVYRKKLLEVFKYFIGVCEENGLRYFCSGGTAIGAVRHNGMIPWDDDIDVLMPRSDYNKLMVLGDSLRKDGFAVSSPRNDDAAMLTKLYNLNTTVWEIKQMPFVCGVYLDIFPMDEVDFSKTKFLKEYKRFRNYCRIRQIARMHYSIKDIYDFLKSGDTKLFIKGVLSKFIPSFIAPIYRKKILSFEDSYAESNGDYYASFYGDYFEREYIKKEWFEDYIEFPFEDFNVRMPKGYHEYLTMVFKNYMQLPPEEKRVSHHYHYYLNLEKGMTIREINKIICK